MRPAGVRVCVGAACLRVGPAAVGAGLEWKLWLTGQRPPSCRADDKCAAQPGHLPAGRSRHVTGEKIAMSESNHHHRCCCRGVNRNISISVPSGGKDARAGCSAGGQRRPQIHPHSRTWRGAPWCSLSPCSGLGCLSRGCGAGGAHRLGPFRNWGAKQVRSSWCPRSRRICPRDHPGSAGLCSPAPDAADGGAGGCSSLLPCAGSKAKSSFLVALAQE